jgi:prevent-host-death family protein
MRRFGRPPNRREGEEGGQRQVDGDERQLDFVFEKRPARLRISLTTNRTVLYGLPRRHAAMIQKGAEEARNQLPHLLEAAESGQATLITKRGRPVAALVPVDRFLAAAPQAPLTPVAGSGRGLWGKASARTIRRLRDEWSR